jgi:hypothetical protein
MSLAALAQDARQLMEEVQRRAQCASQRYEGLLRVFDAKGKVTEKRWRYDRIGSPGSSKVLLRFTAPADVKGLALLVFHYPDRPADQWMWTPALQRNRRITLQDRSARFYGTDFSYEDVEDPGVDQFDYASLGDDTLDGEPCWRVQAKPRKNRASQYTALRLWVGKQNYVIAQVESYIRDQLVRRLKCNAVENVQGIRTARLIEISDLRRGGRTELRLDKLEYNLPMTEDEFTLEALRRGR